MCSNFFFTLEGIHTWPTGAVLTGYEVGLHAHLCENCFV